MLANKVTEAAAERVAVSLKTLVDLAKPAQVLQLDHLAIRAQQSGGYVSRFKGRGMEFDEARLYQPGDDIRTIDWRVTARTGKTHTKIFREERERPVFISVDDRSAMHFATHGVFKSVLAAKLAGLLAWAAQHHGDRIGGQLFSEQSCRELKPQNGKQGVLRFLNACVDTGNPARISPKTPTHDDIALEHVFARLSHHARPGNLVYIISDFRGFNASSETHLAKLAQHCAVVLIFVYDALECQLPAKGRYRFTNDARDVVVDTRNEAQLVNYQQRFTARKQTLEQFAKKHGLAFIQCSTTEEPIHCLR
jgi:uncharacterized protein (DUF58 family)